MKVDGACHCGKLTYEAEVDPENVIICHCSDCQNISDAPYRVSVVQVKAEDFDLHGTPKTYVKTADSGNRISLAFCGELRLGTLLDSRRLFARPEPATGCDQATRSAATPKLKASAGLRCRGRPTSAAFRKIPDPPTPK